MARGTCLTEAEQEREFLEEHSSEKERSQCADVMLS